MTKLPRPRPLSHVATLWLVKAWAPAGRACAPFFHRWFSPDCKRSAAKLRGFPPDFCQQCRQTSLHPITPSVGERYTQDTGSAESVASTGCFTFRQPHNFPITRQCRMLRTCSPLVPLVDPKRREEYISVRVWFSTSFSILSPFLPPITFSACCFFSVRVNLRVC